MTTILALLTGSRPSYFLVHTWIRIETMFWGGEKVFLEGE